MDHKLAAVMTPAEVNLILTGTLALFICIVVLPTTSKANEVVFVGHDSGSVDLHDLRFTEEIWWPAEGDDEAAYFLQHAIETLPLIQEFVGFPAVKTSSRIELGHDHSDTLLDTIRMGGCLQPERLGCTLEEDSWLLSHELTHIFVPSWISTSWFAEATANITSHIVRAQLGIGRFDIPRDAVQWRATDSEEEAIREGWIDEDGAAITLLSGLDPHPVPGGNEYLIGSVVGDVFLGKVYLLLGHDLFSSAYDSLARQNPTVEDPLTNDDIQDAFLAQAGRLECAYQELVWLYLDRNDPVDCSLALDDYEVNDSFDEAAPIGPGHYDLSFHQASDMDYFSIPVPAGHRMKISVSSLLSERIDLFLYDSERNIVGEVGVEDGNITAEHTTARPDIFFLEIFSEEGSILLYDLKVWIYGENKASLDEDPYERNNSLDESAQITEGLHDGLSIHIPEDDDWYSIEVEPNQWLEIELSNIRQYADLDARIQYSDGRTLAAARPEVGGGALKTARAFMQPCRIAPQTLYIHVTGRLGEYAKYISEYNLRISIVNEGFDPQRLCDIARLLAETDQANVFNLFAQFPGRMHFEPCLTCSLQDHIDKRMMIKAFVKEQSGEKISIDPIPTLLPFEKGASKVAVFTRRLNKLAKEWIPSVLLSGPTPEL